MGVLGLSKLLYDRTPGAIKEQELKVYFGRRIAIDASMAVYQFVIAMKGFQEGQSVELTNEAGDVTSHLSGIFFRTLRMIDEGLRPIYVFDGKPPTLKASELESRRQRAEDAKHEFEKAKEEGDDEAMEKMSKRMVRVGRDQMEEVKTLLRLMGIPVVQAPSEAEAQCAELVKKNKAWAVGTEDMDALAFGSRVMLRHLTYGEAKKRPIAEYHLDEILEASGFSMQQFIDLCILLGCDYVPRISGIGPHKAWEGIKKYGSLEAFIESLDGTRYVVPEEFNYKDARNFFLEPEVTPGEEIDIQFREPDEEGLIKFLVDEKLFSKERVLKGIQRLRDALTKKTQGRLDQFFTITKPQKQVNSEASTAGTKRNRGAVALPGVLQRKSSSGHKKAVKK
ncbi:flap endonuclease-1 (FEN-1), putative [Trypanosoma brucei gambiense DAL972]|uniref:Flap endonuclease 1 n=3 Tax=Trypanosoma brucei TaxID=5691 RepID=FEN1_TRYB2|nr:flap endonuclease-1 (FEN-1), putative [Trypanosoma brucei gambiense DAL972]XP_843679.1 flap endonuclease-1 (FEN-1), putative [Trypanosoma brucei brucei TREU927]C9ZKW4.1 RecName: Full=Flap endonuclease 1; Short=FEN-1; AltName: Full=Flap structure-specific endonuclease 1 [Trypanosoma brucei gambiense DAL972]Q57WW6.1 RecName: Full=Flap endonuclease 1; Short=FEN-1; AltName: Full=Flap structure-specific endonuclease 1 [Trypanosoma brucei brucei TREU927]AAX69901.1 flap endonuclease-1 (FEN-1), puta|eukprot:XP_011772000.1 flap endonuclease-1 (FEN-1), putative [Trypanosoma brucei gambiense DAL972]